MKNISIAILSLILAACNTNPTFKDISDTSGVMLDSVVDTMEIVGEKLASNNVKNTAQEILDVTALNNFFQLPGNTKPDKVKTEGRIIRAALGVWVNNPNVNLTYPGNTIKIDPRIERTIQQRISTLKTNEILSWRQPYWGAMWVKNPSRSYGVHGERCVNLEIGTPHRIMVRPSSMTACLNSQTGIYEPQEVRHTQWLPVEPISNFGHFIIPGERIDTWNLR